MTRELINSPLGVCVLPQPGNNAARTASYPEYVYEILDHFGVCYDAISLDQLSDRLSHIRVLLTVGEVALSDELSDALRSWVKNGGRWISVAGLCGMADMFGVEAEPPGYSSWGGGVSTLGEGYLKSLDSTHPVLSHLQIPLHFFNGIPVKAVGDGVIAASLDCHGRETSRAAVVENKVGKGTCLLISADITGSVVLIQQGIGITRDGVPAPDGTAPICDNVLKSGDGAVMDWIFDREQVEGVPGFNAFLQPIADQWRELLLRAVFYCAEQSDVSLPVLWLYPRNLPALGHISHDTDGNVEECGRSMLEVLEKGGINSTWCVISPGYSKELIDDIHSAGHELAMHYDTMTDGRPWGEDEFQSQWECLNKLFDGKKIVSNKNHYLRWEGDMEMFEWCEKRGILLDQSKGASKTGEAGFGFGACHPYYPARMDGSLVNVLEMPTPTQDLMIFAPEELRKPLMNAVLRHHGILHLLFHPAHIQKPGVADALLESIKKGREQGMEWWTASRISSWEIARRTVCWSTYNQGTGSVKVTLQAGKPLPDATIMWLTSRPGRVKVDGKEAKSTSIKRWGFTFTAVQVDAGENTAYQIEVTE